MSYESVIWSGMLRFVSTQGCRKMARYSPIGPHEFDDLLDVLSRSSDFPEADNDCVLSLYQLRRECAIVHAMSQEERDAPELALEHERQARIAKTAGVTKTEVSYLVQRQQPGVVSQRRLGALATGWRVTTLCPATHLEMATGKCPWCGRELFDSRPRW
ncbi:MAG: hypothetical protein ACYC4B_24100 [Pirellulaceae bacterium]